MPKVSVIVPVFNVERYFDQCAQSLLNQTFQDIEIIFVNDGSSDDCHAMCDAYSSQRPDIVKVIHQENQGQNAAWNNGLNIASGLWVCFVDSDDWVEMNMVETMLKYAENDDADIHVFGHCREYKDGTVYHSLEECALTQEEKSNLSKNGILLSEAWGRLFNRAFIERNELYFYPEHFHHEDYIYNLHAFYHASKICLHTEVLYHYRMVASSFMNRWDAKRTETYSLLIRRHSEFVDRHYVGEQNVLLKNRVIIDLCIVRFANYYIDPRSGFTKRETIGFLKGHFNNEPFKSAIKKYPLSALRFKQRIGILLLRSGLVRIWLVIYGVFDRMNKMHKKSPEVMYE